MDLPYPITWHGLTNGQGDSLNVYNVVSLWYGADRAPYHGDFHRNFHHWREALVRKLPQASKEPLGRGVWVNQCREQQVQKVHCYILVDYDNSDPVEPGYRVNTGGELAKEVGQPPSGTTLHQ